MSLVLTIFLPEAATPAHLGVLGSAASFPMLLLNFCFWLDLQSSRFLNSPIFLQSFLCPYFYHSSDTLPHFRTPSVPQQPSLRSGASCSHGALVFTQCAFITKCS